jgi:ParB family transcriptional regulator, chromosome partitioning protein
MNTLVRPSKHEWASIDEIELPTNTRPYNATDVVALKRSIEAIGLQTPLTVVEVDIGPPRIFQLITGRHRLEALRLLKVDRIPVRVVDFNDAEARMWTISENLHRSELTVVQRAEQIAEWVRLSEEQRAAEEVARKLEPKLKAPEPDVAPEPGLPFSAVSSQVGTKLSVRGRDGEGRPESGVNAAARELGIGKAEAHRAIKIDSIAPEAKAALLAAGLDDNQTVALKVANYDDEDQVEAVAEIVAEREAKAKPAYEVASPSDLPPPQSTKPLRNLEYLAAGELARWIKQTTPNDRGRVIRLLRDCAAILEMEIGMAAAS